MITMATLIVMMLADDNGDDEGRTRKKRPLKL
jgi:hypothetical protein